MSRRALLAYTLETTKDYWYGLGDYDKYQVRACAGGQVIAHGLTREQAYRMQAEHNEALTNEQSGNARATENDTGSHSVRIKGR